MEGILHYNNPTESTLQLVLDLQDGMLIFLKIETSKIKKN